MSEIPFWFHDRPKWVSGINKHTTCQDILHSLVRAHVDKSSAATGRRATTTTTTTTTTTISDSDVKRTAGQLALVEQWRGVERPLGNASKILKLWLAWGEERSQVKFVVKRVSSSSQQQQQQQQPQQPVGSGTLERKRAAAAAAVLSGASSTSTGVSRRTRRRNSRLAASRARAADTYHPSALPKGCNSYYHSGAAAAGAVSSSSSLQSGEIERLMRIILSQGETIHSQLKKLQEREGQIDRIEQEVHDTRTKTAGKDYLLNAYLNEKRSSSASDHEQQPQKDVVILPECLREMIEALGHVHRMNEKLETAENKINDMQCQLSDEVGGAAAHRQLHHQHGGLKGSSSSSSSSSSAAVELEDTKFEVNQLRVMNDKVGKEIDYNRNLIANMRSAFDERKALVSKLERDVSSVESEGHKLKEELQRVRRRDLLTSPPPPPPTSSSSTNERVPLIPSPAPHHHNPPGGEPRGPTDEELDEELLNDIMGGPHGCQFHLVLSNSQLYEDHRPPMRPNEVEQEEKLFINQLHMLHIKTGGSGGGGGLEEELMTVLPSSSCTDASRINTTGSPGSSTSGNSSGSGTTAYSDKSAVVRFSDRDVIMATPDLPPLPPDADFPLGSCSSLLRGQHVSQYTKSILKSVDASGDLDSNSDTGLSSLHSSSDEGTYVLDTLV